MALSIYKTFIAGEVLTAADMNALQNHFVNNALTLISPLTGDLDFDGNSAIMDADGDLALDESADDILAIKVGSTELVKFDLATASAVNGLTVQASAAGTGVTLTTHGSDAAVNLIIDPKSTGAIDINATELILDADADTSITADTDDVIDIKLAGSDVYQITATQFDFNGKILVLDADADSTLRESADDVIRLRLQGMDAVIFDGDVASPVNGFTITTSATTVAPQLRAQGTDSNISINFVPAGTGVLQCNGKTLPYELLAVSASVGGTEIDFSGSLTSTYDEYWIKMEVVVGGDNQTMTMRTDSNGGASYDAAAGDYRYAANALDDAGTATTIVSGGAATSVQLSEADLESTRTSFYTVHFMYVGDGASGLPTFEWTASYLTSGAVHQHIKGSGHRTSVTRLDSVRFRETGGANITGVAYLYGIRKA